MTRQGDNPNEQALRDLFDGFAHFEDEGGPALVLAMVDQHGQPHIVTATNLHSYADNADALRRLSRSMAHCKANWKGNNR